VVIVGKTITVELQAAKKSALLIGRWYCYEPKIGVEIQAVYLFRDLRRREVGEK
jgi:hypothetical protein